MESFRGNDHLVCMGRDGRSLMITLHRSRLCGWYRRNRQCKQNVSFLSTDIPVCKQRIRSVISLCPRTNGRISISQPGAGLPKKNCDVIEGLFRVAEELKRPAGNLTEKRYRTWSNIWYLRPPNGDNNNFEWTKIRNVSKDVSVCSAGERNFFYSLTDGERSMTRLLSRKLGVSLCILRLLIQFEMICSKNAPTAWHFLVEFSMCGRVVG